MFKIFNIFVSNMSSRKYFYYRRPIGDSSETHRRSIEDRHVWSETQRRPTCLIWHWHAWSETLWRPTCLIGYRHAWSETHRRPTCLIKHVQRVFGQEWRSSSGMSVPDEARQYLMGILSSCRSTIRHVDLRSGISVSDQTCWWS